MFSLEAKLRYYAQDSADVHVVAVYDCCRVSLETKKYRALAKGMGRNESEEESFQQETEHNYVKYFHLTACSPGGIAKADGGFAKNLLYLCK